MGLALPGTGALPASVLVLPGDAPDAVRSVAYKLKKVLGPYIQLSDADNDQTELQTALDAPGSLGGLILLADGAFTMANKSGQTYGLLWPVQQTKAHTSLLGMGKRATQLNWTPTAATDALIRIDAVLDEGVYRSVDEGGELGHLELVNLVTPAIGFDVPLNSVWAKAWMHDVYFKHFKVGIQLGVAASAGVYWDTFERLRFQGCVTGIDCLPLNDTNHLLFNSIFMAGTDGNAVGFKMRGQKITFINCEVNLGDGSTGFWLQDGDCYTLIGCGGDSVSLPTYDFRIDSGITGLAVDCWGTRGWLNNSDKFRIMQSYGPNAIPICVGGTRVIIKAFGSDLFNVAALTKNVLIWTQPANTVLKQAYIALNLRFESSGAMTDLDVTIGDGADNDGILAAAMDLRDPAGPLGATYKTRGAYWNAATAAGYYTATAHDWYAYAIAVGANLDTMTKGELYFIFDYD